MSLPDRDCPSNGVRRLGAVAAVALALAAAGCTVRPLYGDVTSATTSGVSSAKLASIQVNPVDDRVGQEVRNHLIFLFGGGAGQPAQPAYTLNLTTSVTTSAAALVQVGTSDLEPTSAVSTVRVTYGLADANGTPIASGVRVAQAPYDVSRQAFAALRAQRDAQNRAAREVAELVRLAVAQHLERPATAPTAAPAVITAPQEVDGFDSEERPENIETQ